MKKFKSFMDKLKKNIIMYIVVWLIFAILLVAPVTYTLTNARLEGLTWLEGIMTNFAPNVIKLPITEVFHETYFSDFIKGIEYFSIVYIILVIYAIYKTLPKGAYDKIEHGSSDWCENGEEYKVLSKKNGLILSKEHRLPVDKPGNINVLIVGRFRFW